MLVVKRAKRYKDGFIKNESNVGRVFLWRLTRLRPVLLETVTVASTNHDIYKYIRVRTNNIITSTSQNELTVFERSIWRGQRFSVEDNSKRQHPACGRCYFGTRKAAVDQLEPMRSHGDRTVRPVAAGEHLDG